MRGAFCRPRPWAALTLSAARRGRRPAVRYYRHARARRGTTRGDHRRSVPRDRRAGAGAAHVPRRGARPEGPRAAAQITNYQHDHRGASYDDLVFSYDFAAGEKRAVFTLEATATATPPDTPCVYARIVPERYDDMAWENDRIAHRMYGFALNTPAAGGERLRGSGIDVWGKRVSYPIVDRWYAKGHDQFHKDEEGEGLDLYSIGGSRGAGGTGVWDGTKLWTSDNFVNAQVLSNGPRRAAFQPHVRALGCGRRRQGAGDQAVHRRLRPQFRRGGEHVRFRGDRSRGRYRHHRASAGDGLSRRPC